MKTNKLKMALCMLVVAVCFSMNTVGIFAAGGSESDLKDIKGHWAAAQIIAAKEKGYVSGYSDGTFKPNSTITRAEFITMTVNILNLPHSSEGTPWYQPYVASALEMGIHSKKDFDSNWSKPITRLEMARIVARSLALNEDYKAYLTSFGDLYNGDLPFVDYRKFTQSDVPLLALAFGSRIFGGYPDASFGVEKNATRAEAVVMLNNMNAARQKRPDTYQYLNEMKEIAETGTNTETVSQLVRKFDVHNKKAMTVEHANYSATVKRVYVVPVMSNIVSMYERKFLWDRNKMPMHYLQIEGFAVTVADVTFKKDGDRDLYVHNLTSSGFYYQEPQEHFGFIFPMMKFAPTVKKGQTDEMVFYGSYGKDYISVDFTSNNSQSVYLLYNPKNKYRTEGESLNEGDTTN